MRTATSMAAATLRSVALRYNSHLGIVCVSMMVVFVVCHRIAMPMAVAVAVTVIVTHTVSLAQHNSSVVAVS
eukprot:COSAG02_NODE_5499_length_4278_cov_4.999282_6_plen_72_part_00